MYISSVQSYTDLYFDMVRTTTRKTISNDNGEKVKEIVETNYRPYNHLGQLDSTAQTNPIVDFRA
jgi:hypothetical protein